MHKSLKFNILTEGQSNGISATCKKYKISRTIYYRWMDRYKSNGIDGLVDIKKDFKPSNRTNNEIEQSIINLIRTYPRYGPRAIKYLLEEVGHNISESAVYNVMKRHQLTNKESRIKFAKKSLDESSTQPPPLQDLTSGDCWVFWMTDYGHTSSLPHLYEYTFFDLISKVSCTRLYDTVSYKHFEDLLAGAAIPVARSLQFNTKHLCFFSDIQLRKGRSHNFQSKINHTIIDYGFDVKIHFLEQGDLFNLSNSLRETYTQGCLSYLLPMMHDGLHLDQLRVNFQRYLRIYNLETSALYGDGQYSPINYHLKMTNSKLILPLWAYIDRDY